MTKETKESATAEQETKRYLTRDQILGTPEREFEDLYIPQWQGIVRVRSLTAKERDRFESDITVMRGKGRNREINMRDNVRARLVAISVVDPKTSEPIFTRADIEALGNKSAAAIDAIYAVAQRLSRFTEDDMEELAENFQ